MRCSECQSIIDGDYFKHVTKRGIAVCSEHSCQIEHAKERVKGKDLAEFIADRLCNVSREMLLEIALDYVADSEQEFCEWFFSGAYTPCHAYGDDEDEQDVRSWSSFDRERE